MEQAVRGAPATVMERKPGTGEEMLSNHFFSQVNLVIVITSEDTGTLRLPNAQINWTREAASALMNCSTFCYGAGRASRE